MEFDDERFLTLVFQYPCIYDNHDPNYKNTDSREICWSDIGNEMHCSGELNHFTFVTDMHLNLFVMYGRTCLSTSKIAKYLSCRYRIS